MFFFLISIFFYKENINKIRNILTKNNYPIYIINNIISKTLNNNKDKRNNRNNKNNNEPSEEINFYSVPYVPKLTETKTMKHMINDETAILAHKSNQTIRQLFTRNKTKQDILKIANTVYEIKCEGNENEKCDKVYVGTSKRMLGTRIAEHKADVNKERESTALAQHAKECNHVMNFDKIKILDKEKRVNKRFTLESLRIQERIHFAMNTREDKDNTKLHYSAAII